MKKAVLSILLIGSFVFPAFSNAQTVTLQPAPECSIPSDQMTPAQMQTCLNSLVALLAQLLNELAALTPAPAPTSTPLSPPSDTTSSTPVLGSVAPQTNQITTPMPEVQKAITIEQGPYPLIYAYYSENGVNLPNIQLTLSADDAGKITSSGSPDKFKLADNSQLTHPNVGIDSQIGATFEYQPNATGTRMITVTGNGVSQSIQVPGAQE